MSAFKLKTSNEKRELGQTRAQEFSLSQQIFGEDSKLLKLGEEHSKAYGNADPFPHISFGNFLPQQVAEGVFYAFPEADELDYYKYDNPLERKLAFDQVGKLPRSLCDVLTAMNQPPFLAFLEGLTGIENLIPDPYYRGGGIHLSKSGGKLDVHVDFNIHPKLKLVRRLNVLIYFNKQWRETYNGDLQLWKGHKDKNTGKHVLTELKKRIYPNFNTFVCWSTSENSYHGFPDPITCPTGMCRKSIATYYYTADENVSMNSHSTVYVKRPNEDDSLESLREERSGGRTSSNVEDELLS